MSEKNKASKTTIDFDIGIGELIPATQEAFKDNSFSIPTRKEEKTNLILWFSTFKVEQLLHL